MEQLQVASGEFKTFFTKAQLYYLVIFIINSYIYRMFCLSLKSLKTHSINIPKLTLNNNVMVEFNFQSCLKKDKDFVTIKVQGTLRDGLYQLSAPHIFLTQDMFLAICLSQNLQFQSLIKLIIVVFKALVILKILILIKLCYR